MRCSRARFGKATGWSRLAVLIEKLSSEMLVSSIFASNALSSARALEPRTESTPPTTALNLRRQRSRRS